VDHVHFAYIRTHGLYFVCTTKFNVSPMVAVELLTRLARVIKDYCGILSEESLRLNFSLVYELMDEVLVYRHMARGGADSETN
jgi:AP-4 complex subunit mu-1